MPLTIKELHVKMVVEENSNHYQNKSATTVSNNDSEERLIQKCIEAVLQILEDKNEK